MTPPHFHVSTAGPQRSEFLPPSDHLLLRGRRKGRRSGRGGDVIDLQLVQDGDFITGQDVDAKPQIKFGANVF